jgi:hypothetical protein
MQSVYLETTIPSYLAARPSGMLAVAADQQSTHAWWSLQLPRLFHPNSLYPGIPITSDAMNNPIIQEVRDARDALAGAFGYNLHKIIENAMERERTQQTENRQWTNKSLIPTGKGSATSLPKRPRRPAAE